MTHNTQDLDVFSPYRLGPLRLPNRLVMAPMTRNRAGPGEVPGPLAVAYYTQRASAGLIVTEGTQISRQGQGYPGTPGIFTPDQIAGWKRVTNPSMPPAAASSCSSGMSAASRIRRCSRAARFRWHRRRCSRRARP